MMDGRQKLYFLLDAIDDARVIAPSGQPLIIDPTNDLNRKYRDIELQQLFSKLEKDEQVLTVLQDPSGRIKTIDFVEELDPYDLPYEQNDGCWHVELLPSFGTYFLKIQEEPGYQDFTGKKPPNKPQLSRKALEKIWSVLQEIEDKRGITSAQDDISIPQVHLSKVKDDIGAQNASDERQNILRKLENEEHAIKDVRFPKNFREYVYLKIGDKYTDTYSKYEEAYKKAAKEYQEQVYSASVLHNDLSLLHPEIFTKCQSLFEKAEYPEAVEKSFKVVRDRLRVLTGHETGSEAFGKGKIHIRGAAAQNVDHDFNEGAKFLTMAIDMFRNEKSHTSDAKIDDPHRAYEYLALSSLAMNLLDQAEVGV